MNCPKCMKDQMRPESYDGIDLLRCPLCKGMFFEKGDVIAFLENKLGSIADDAKFAPTSEILDGMQATCPRCSTEMRWAVAPGGVVINQCEACGAIFLDAGELAKLEERF